MKKNITLLLGIATFVALAYTSWKVNQLETEKSELLRQLQQVKKPSNHLFNLAWWKYGADIHLVEGVHRHTFNEKTVGYFFQPITEGLIAESDKGFFRPALLDGASWLTGYSSKNSMVTAWSHHIRDWVFIHQDNLDPFIILEGRRLLDKTIKIPKGEYLFPEESNWIFQKYDIDPIEISAQIRGAPHNETVKQTVEKITNKIRHLDTKINTQLIWIGGATIGLLFFCLMYFLFCGREERKTPGGLLMIAGTPLLLVFAFITPLFHIMVDISEVNLNLMFAWKTQNISIWYTEKSFIDILKHLLATPSGINIVTVILLLTLGILLPLVETSVEGYLILRPEKNSYRKHQLVTLGVFSFIDILIIVISGAYITDLQTATNMYSGLQYFDEKFSFLRITPEIEMSIKSGAYFLILQYGYLLAKKAMFGRFILWNWKTSVYNIQTHELAPGGTMKRQKEIVDPFILGQRRI